MPEENNHVIDAFLHAMSDAKALKIDATWGQQQGNGRQLLPNQGKYGGFFTQDLASQPWFSRLA
jgi:16S rRNA C967 or C1407 C5-methylase (RsmB/RsmF family)